jgi:2'-5' RNA ligase
VSVRAFLAVDLPEAARAQAARALETVRAAVDAPARWVDPEKLHLTLKFLGQVEERRLPRIAELAAARIARLGPIEMELGGFGAFPHARAARIVWLGVSAGAPALARAARKLDSAAARAGVPRERRPFRAHLTLGRLRTPGRVPLERLVAPPGDPFSVEEVVLYESRPDSNGSTYVPLARLPLCEEGRFETRFDFAPETQEM